MTERQILLDQRCKDHYSHFFEPQQDGSEAGYHEVCSWCGLTMKARDEEHTAPPICVYVVVLAVCVAIAIGWWMWGPR